MKRSIKLEGQLPGQHPYTPAVEANGFVFISGQIAADKGSNRLYLDNITMETEKVMENIKEVLGLAGLGFEDLVKCTIYLSNMQFYAEVNRVYLSCFTGDVPARETIAVKELPRGVNVEIACIATR